MSNYTSPFYYFPPLPCNQTSPKISLSRSLCLAPSSSSSSFSSTQNPLKTLTPPILIKLGSTPSIKSLNLLLSFLLKCQQSNLLLHLFSQISSNSIRISSRTRSLVARCILKSDRFEEDEAIISHTQKFDFVPRKGLWDSIIQCLCVEEENPERAFSLLNQRIGNYGIPPLSIHFDLWF